MNNKVLIIILWLISLGSVSLVVGAYLLHFQSQNISSNSAEWGQFGDYIGGLLNPVLGILNLIVLTYLTIRIVKYEDTRNQFTLQELARPLGDITCQREREGLDISIENCGLGPLRIKKVSILYNNVEYSSFKDILPKMPPVTAGLNWQVWRPLGDDESIIAKDKFQTLVKIWVETKDGSSIPFFEKVYKILQKTKLVIDYTDIYDRVMPQAFFDFTKLPDFQ